MSEQEPNSLRKTIAKKVVGFYEINFNATPDLLYQVCWWTDYKDIKKAEQDLIALILR